jgi:hypothetical protein
MALNFVAEALQNPNSIENVQRLDVIIERALELESVITDKQLHDAAQTLCETSLIAQKINSGLVGRRISSDRLISAIHLGEDQIRELIERKEDRVIKVSRNSKQRDEMSIGEFFEKFDQLKKRREDLIEVNYQSG